LGQGFKPFRLQNQTKPFAEAILTKPEPTAYSHKNRLHTEPLGALIPLKKKGALIIAPHFHVKLTEFMCEVHKNRSAKRCTKHIKQISILNGVQRHDMML
jgi:hypothetical protein